MSSNDWMLGRDISDIQIAIESQTLQTAFEKQASTISDAGFQSFLQNAPIPRIYMEAQGAGQVINTGALTDLVWGQAARLYDPYSMHLAANTTDVTIPVDGFYSFYCNTNFISPAVAAVWEYELQFTTIQSKVYGAGIILDVIIGAAPIVAGTEQWALNIVMNKPFNQGDSFKVQIFQSSGGAVTLGAAGFKTSIGGTWSAPYKQFTTGAGGN